MLILIAILLALIPAFAILYPFLSRNVGNEWLDDESSPHADLERRWDVALAGIKSAELEYSIGNLEEEDYRWLRNQYLREAAVVMRGLELEDEQEEELLSTIEMEIQKIRQRVLGPDNIEAADSEPGHKPQQESTGG